MKAFLTEAGLVIMVSALALQADADQGRTGTTEKNEHIWSGTLSAVDLQNKTLRADNWWSPKTFVIGKKCLITAMGEDKATLRDLRTNEKVRITYRDVDGVLVADHVADESLRFRGTVQNVDQQKGTLTLAEGLLTRTFKVAVDCKVVTTEGIEGSLDYLKPGDKAEVIYGLPNSSPLAYRINQISLSWEGKLEAIDLPERIVKADDPLGERQFSVAARCRIVVGSNQSAQLSDLKLDRDYTFTYEQVNGVNVADQISEVAEPALND